MVFESGWHERFSVLWARTEGLFVACLVRVRRPAEGPARSSGQTRGVGASGNTEIVLARKGESRLRSVERLLQAVERRCGAVLQVEPGKGAIDGMEDRDGWVIAMDVGHGADALSQGAIWDQP